MTYTYPAIYSCAEEGGYYIHFPDIPNCFTDADNLEVGSEKAYDVLHLMLCELIQNNSTLSHPSTTVQLQKFLKDDAFIVHVTCIIE